MVVQWMSISCQAASAALTEAVAGLEIAGQPQAQAPSSFDKTGRCDSGCTSANRIEEPHLMMDLVALMRKACIACSVIH